MKLRKLLRRTYYGTKVRIVSGVEDSVKVLVDDYTLECGKQNVPIMYAGHKVEAIRIDSAGTLIIYVEDTENKNPLLGWFLDEIQKPCHTY